MQGVTLTISLFCSVLALVLRPHHALVVYIAGLLWYPSYLAVSIGTVDIVIGRFVIGVLFLRCMFDNKIRYQFKWSRLDTWVTVNMIVSIGVMLITQPSMAIIENRGGFLMDTWFAYIVARFIITDRAKLVSVVKLVSIILVPLAILGLIESITGWQPFVPLRQFHTWLPGAVERPGNMRWGFTRAVGPFTHPILFGGGFVLFMPLIYYLRHEKSNWHNLAYIFSALMILGALSSMSSGPWIMVILVLSCLIMERYKQWVKPMLITLVFSCIFIEILSNRTFYHVFASYASRLGGSGWHRAALIDVSISHFGEWWLAGYRGEDPGWGHYFGMGHTDVTNEYILSGVMYGISGVIALCVMLFVAFRGLLSAYKKVGHPVMKSLYWYLGSILFAVSAAWMSVSFFGQLRPLFYCVLGIIGSCSLFPLTQRIRYRKVLIDNNDKGVIQKRITQL